MDLVLSKHRRAVLRYEEAELFALWPMDLVFRKLDALLGEEYGKLTGVTSDVEYLKLHLQTISDRLDDAYGEYGELDPELKEFKSQSVKMANAIEDWIDEVQHHYRGRNGSKAGSVHETTTNLKVSRTQHQIDNKVKWLKSRVEDLSSWRPRSRLGRNDSFAPSRPKVMAVENRLMMFYTGMDGLVGTDGPLRELSSWLTMTGPGQTKLKVASIVGLAGLGKSTLAYELYRCPHAQFDCRAFAVVHRESNIGILLRSILTQLEVTKYIHHEQHSIQHVFNRTREFLVDKRYLIVVDDVWSVKDWKIISDAFPRNELGSRIITTTRIHDVASACCGGDDGFIYKIKPLSGLDSKRLFMQRLFGTKDTCPPLTEVCNQILRFCGGMPLAIICIASMLSNQTITKQSCEEVVNSLRSGYIMSVDMEYLKDVLSLSYYDLPHQLRTRLLYLSIFPENHTIHRDHLVKKWIAEGFVNENQEAIRCFHKLLSSNVIQPVECNTNCEVITCRIHPMVHLLLTCIARQEEFAGLLHYKDIFTSDSMCFRRLSVHCPDTKNSIDSLGIVSQLCRSLTVFGHANRFLLKIFKGLRILDLEGCSSIEKADLEYICREMVLLKQLVLKKIQITELPQEIVNLKHLESLDVGETQITELPPEIGNLYYLERLDARKSKVKELPYEVTQLTKLVHLLLGDKDSSEGVKLPDGIGKLRSLQLLCTLDLKKCSAFCVKELGKLTELKELAVVSNDGPGDTSKNNTLLASLEKSTKLQSLVIYGDFSLNTIQSTLPYDCLVIQKKLTVVRRSLSVPMVISDQRFRSMLELDISVCKVEEKDLEILRDLPRLQHLTVRFEVLPRTTVRISHEGFASLESFCVDCRMPRVYFKEGAMPNLKHLELKLYAGSASEDPMGIRHLLNLKKILFRYSRWYARNKGLKATIDATKAEAKEHQNRINLSITEENKDGSCSTTSETVEVNRNASCNITAEIEAEEKHADGTSSAQNNYASGSGTNEISVVE